VLTGLHDATTRYFTAKLVFCLFAAIVLLPDRLGGALLQSDHQLAPGVHDTLRVAGFGGVVQLNVSVGNGSPFVSEGDCDTEPKLRRIAVAAAIFGDLKLRFGTLNNANILRFRIYRAAQQHDGASSRDRR
jgi:hypothetical protein